ncbi:ABC transporter substrate-binding protein [uncultured Oscillibacter sp.]|uniref:ABC transporter substrate-binding protein n=1 Tax=uncultured Oscillibacter sp. TaxID=876091 RepID=UPI00263947A0|nr:ABC transporter substrate-binding protein [uncultured Oscillibacter sp.]
MYLPTPHSNDNGDTMKKHLLKLFCLLLPVLFLTGCWQEELPENTGLISPGEELPQEPDPELLLPEFFSLPYAPDQSLDPIDCPDGPQQTVASLICEGLFRLTPDLEAESLLCQSYSYDSERYAYTFTLRPGVLFSDGSPLTARDVRTALERARRSERYQARLAQVSSISAGDGTVTITLSRPNTGFPALLDIPISKESGGVPLGTGPYFLTQDEGGAFLAANSTWWQGHSQPVERIGLTEASGQDAVLYRFSSHEVQLITADLTGTDPAALTGSVSQWEADTTILQYVGLNTAAAPLDNAALRRALGESLNRKHIVSGFLSGHGRAAQFPVSPLSSLYPEELEVRFSADAPVQAISRSGYVPERTLTLLVNSENSFKTAVADYLAESLTAAGVPVETRILPWEEYTAALEAGDFDLYYGEVRLTADWNLSSLLSTGGALNYGGWTDAEADSLLAAYSAAENRTTAMEALCAYLQQQSPILPVCFKSTSVLAQTGVLEDLIPTAAQPFYNLAGCTVHLREK